jgi:hypothetical protein
MDAMRIKAGRQRQRVALVAFALALAIGLLRAEPTNAETLAPCDYWTANQTVQRTAYPANGFTYTSSVTYKLFLACPSSYTQIKVVSFSNTMTVSGGASNLHHTDVEGGVFRWFSCWINGQNCYSVAWISTVPYDHVGNGTWTRSATPNVVIPYNTTAAVFDHWNGCSIYGTGVGHCKMAYKFLAGTIVVYWYS